MIPVAPGGPELAGIPGQGEPNPAVPGGRSHVLDGAYLAIPSGAGAPSTAPDRRFRISQETSSKLSQRAQIVQLSRSLRPAGWRARFDPLGCPLRRRTGQLRVYESETRGGYAKVPTRDEHRINNITSGKTVEETIGGSLQHHGPPQAAAQAPRPGGLRSPTHLSRPARPRRSVWRRRLAPGRGR